MNDPRKPRWIMNPDGSIFHVDTRARLCGLEGQGGARCTRVDDHPGGHDFNRQYPPAPRSKADEFMATSLDPVIDPPTPPKPSSMYPHDMDMPPRQIHPEQRVYGHRHMLAPAPYRDPEHVRVAMHGVIDAMFDHMETEGRPVDLETFRLTIERAPWMGGTALAIRAQVITQAPKDK